MIFGDMNTSKMTIQWVIGVSSLQSSPILYQANPITKDNSIYEQRGRLEPILQ